MDYVCNPIIEVISRNIVICSIHALTELSALITVVFYPKRIFALRNERSWRNENSQIRKQYCTAFNADKRNSSLVFKHLLE